jgi:phage protein D
MGLGAIIAVNDLPAMDLMTPGVVEFIEVHERLGDTTYFSIQFRCDIMDGDISLLGDSRLGPGSMISILVPNGTQVECLVKGPIYAQEIILKNGGDASSVLVKGADSTLAMDREFKSVAYEATDSTAVTTVLGNYTYIPDVGNTAAMHMQTKHNLIQRSSDLQFVRKLARRNGFKFWVTADQFGIETAHFQRPSLDGEPSAELIINRQDFNTNELQISWDAHRPSNVQGIQLDLANKTEIVGAVGASPETLLGGQAQQAFAPDLVTIDLAPPVDDAGDLTARLEAAMIDASYFVHASCETSLQQLNKLVRAHTVVQVTGAGTLHSGKYLVATVTHHLDESAHKMKVQLLRNAIGPVA